LHAAFVAGTQNSVPTSWASDDKAHRQTVRLLSLGGFGNIEELPL
jgi:hypothetical protein